MSQLNNTNPTLLALATATRQVAQEWIDKNLIIQWLSTLLACFAFFNNEQIAWALVSFGFVCKIISFVINIKGQHYHSISREAQRLALLEDSYGKILDNFQVVELRRKISVKIDDKAKQIPYAQPYYSSSAKKGNYRLKENIQQSTFWSKNLLEIYATKIFWTFIISLSILAMVIYVLLVTRSTMSIKIFNPYLLTLGALTFILGLVDYFNVWLACKSSVILFTEVDQRLEKIDIRNFEILLANFADYGIASVTAPPIPFKSYKKNQKRLKELWDQRMGEIEQMRNENALQIPASSRPEITLNDKIIPKWITKQKLFDLLFSVAEELSKRTTNYIITKITVDKIESLSGVPVFDIQLLSNNIIFRHLILRLHEEAGKAKKELEILKRISDESVDLVAYTPLEDPFISQGALFYYHANIQTHDQLFHIHDFVVSFFENVQIDFESYFNKMFSGFKNIANVYEKISGFYSPRSLADCFNNIAQSLPPSYILDLRKRDILKKDNYIQIAENGKFPTTNDTILSSPFSFQSENWFKGEFEILSVGDLNGSIVQFTIKVDGGNCKVIINTKKFIELSLSENQNLSILFIPKLSLYTFSEFLKTECDLDIDWYNPYEVFNKLLYAHPRQGLFFAFRHTDLHCNNCLTSRSNFKIIDVADSNEAMICADLARLEVSLFSNLIMAIKLNSSDVEAILLQIDSEDEIATISKRNALIAKLVKSIRECFFNQFRVSPSDFDINLCYYLEICQQLNFSIVSPLKLTNGMEPIIHYWNNKILKHTFKQ